MPYFQKPGPGYFQNAFGWPVVQPGQVGPGQLGYGRIGYNAPSGYYQQPTMYPRFGFLGPDRGFLGPDRGFLGPDRGFLAPAGQLSPSLPSMTDGLLLLGALGGLLGFAYISNEEAKLKEKKHRASVSRVNPSRKRRRIYR
jgi:hypothetical protein